MSIGEGIVIATTIYVGASLLVAIPAGIFLRRVFGRMARQRAEIQADGERIRRRVASVIRPRTAAFDPSGVSVPPLPKK